MKRILARQISVIILFVIFISEELEGRSTIQTKRLKTPFVDTVGQELETVLDTWKELLPKMVGCVTSLTGKIEAVTLI